MVEAAARARRVAMTGFNWRFVPAMQRFHALVEEGAVGRLFHSAAAGWARAGPTRRRRSRGAWIAPRPATARWATWACT